MLKEKITNVCLFMSNTNHIYHRHQSNINTFAAKCYNVLWFFDSGSSQGVFSLFCVAEHTAECRACCWASWRKASNKMTRGHLRKCVMRCESVVNMSDPGVLTASALSSLCGLCQDAQADRLFRPSVCLCRHSLHTSDIKMECGAAE